MTTEAAVVANLAAEATEANPINPGEIYTVPAGNGELRVVDTDEYAPTPRRVQARRTVNDVDSFVQYLEKHGLPETEVYADKVGNSIVAVIDSHRGAGEPGGWQGHKLTLALEHTDSWKAWIGANAKWFTQVQFAEFIEQHAVDVKVPTSGDLMKIAQDFYMTKGVEYQSSQRLADGQTQLVYKEKVETKGLGELEVPKELELVLQPYVGGPRQFAYANFRTRLDGAQLQIGYVLIRPEEILDGMFSDIVTDLRNGRPVDDVKGITPLAPIAHPVYFGKP